MIRPGPKTGLYPERPLLLYPFFWPLHPVLDRGSQERRRSIAEIHNRARRLGLLALAGKRVVRSRAAQAIVGLERTRIDQGR
jgi:hypothetical protein